MKDEIYQAHIVKTCLLKMTSTKLYVFYQVTDVCGAKRLGYFGTSQFYVALKLLAAAQSGLPIHLESVTASKSAAQRVL